MRVMSKLESLSHIRSLSVPLHLNVQNVPISWSRFLCRHLILHLALYAWNLFLWYWGKAQLLWLRTRLMKAKLFRKSITYTLEIHSNNKGRYFNIESIFHVKFVCLSLYSWSFAHEDRLFTFAQ